MMSGVQGGNFWTGFASGCLASVASSAFHGGTSFDAKGNAIAGSGWAGAGKFADSTVGLLTFGTVSGGAGAALTGGNFWQGAVTGLVVSGLNHLAHQTKQPEISSKTEDGIVPSGEIEFKGLTKDQLSEFRVIPEDVSEETPIFTPTKNGTYEGDGFYHKDFSDQKYWYKVSAGGSVTITYSGGSYHYLSYVSEFWSSIAIARGKYYNVGWEPKSNPHWTVNPFDLKKK